jgi:hypothetical protein
MIPDRRAVYGVSIIGKRAFTLHHVLGSILMANYRLFFIGRDDHIVKAEVLDCPTDSEAVAAARAACGEHPAVEVWELERKVGRVDADTASGKDVW